MLINSIAKTVGVEEVDKILLWMGAIKDGKLHRGKTMLLLESYTEEKTKKLPFLSIEEALEISKQDVLLEFDKIIEENEKAIAEILHNRFGKRIVERLRQNEEINLPSLEKRILSL